MVKSDALSEIGILEFFEVNPRPAFIIDLNTDAARPNKAEGFQIVYSNGALRKIARVHTALLRSPLGHWATRGSDGITSLQELSRFSSHGRIWTKSTLRRRWRVILANGEDDTTNLAEHASRKRKSNRDDHLESDFLQKSGDDQKAVTSSVPSVRQNWDFTHPNYTLEYTPYMKMFLGIDWESSPLGPTKSWSVHLRQVCNMVMADSNPVNLIWGPEKTFIYNEASSVVAGRKHPGILGSRFDVAWSEAWPLLGPTFECVEATGRAKPMDGLSLILERNGYQEETYFSWSVVPLICELGNIAGFYIPLIEITEFKLAERRTTALLKFGEVVATAKDMKSYWQKILQGLSTPSNEYDIPIAILYSMKEDTEMDSSSCSSGSYSNICQLEGALGVPAGHPAAILRLDLGKSMEGLGPLFQDARKRTLPTILRTEDGTLPIKLLEGLQWRGHGDPCKTAAICPIRPTTGDSTMGFLLIGLNPRTPYDQNYQKYVSLLSRQLATSLASIVLFEEEVRSGQNAAEQSALTQAQLAEMLDDTLQRFHAMADVIPCGLAYADATGKLTYANRKWYEIVGLPLDSTLPEDAEKFIHEADAVEMGEVWRGLRTTGYPATFSFRIKDSDHGSGIKWVLGSALTEKEEDGTVTKVTWCLTDITLQKQTAERAVERAQVAEQLSKEILRFKRMSEMAYVAVFHFSVEGCVIDANSTWYEMTGFDPDDPVLKTPGGFKECIDVEHHVYMDLEWTKMTVYGLSVSHELRLNRKKTWTAISSSEPVTGEFWILATGLPIKSEDGTVVSVTGCITDISSQKRNLKDALERADLSEQLLKSRADAEISEQKFTRFAELATIGIFSIAPNGEYNYCNDAWHAILQLPKTQQKYTWDLITQLLVGEADLSAVKDAWEELVTHKKSITLECSIKIPWKAPNITQTDAIAQTWVSLSAYPDLYEDGTIRAVMGCLSDISHLKWTSELQKRRMEEAMEAKRSQEHFIDMTSHEIRNPLSAVIQCTDAIISVLRETSSLAMDDDVRKANSTSIENAEIIASCALHQKRIVDDILTLSKLDSKLLEITPIKVRPVKVIQDALKMFEADAQRADVRIQLEVDESVSGMKIDWLLLDPSRVLQVLINLLTNAIKFTQTQESRVIKVRMAASSERPSDTAINYIATRTMREDLTLGSDWGQGEGIYIHLAVEDSGRGLDDEEKKLLFMRFSQASPKTHIQYGGSGLGLFISRELTELQGGEIAVESQAGVGSIFAFYVKARRASPAPEGPTISKVAGGSRSSSVVEANLSVLVVEDNLINQKVLCKQLRQLGCTVYVANHGREALDFLKTSHYWRGQESNGKKLSIILMDIEMPVMGGLACARHIRQLQRDGSIGSHIPIIAVSANARIDQQKQALDAGMDDVVTKPFRIPELIPKMEQLVKLQKRRRVEEFLHLNGQAP